MKRFTSFIYSVGILISVFCLALTVPSKVEGYYTNMTITDSFSGEYRTYTTQAKDSKWSIQPQLYPTSLLDLSVESVEGKYNELPTVNLTVFEP